MSTAQAYIHSLLVGRELAKLMPAGPRAGPGPQEEVELGLWGQVGPI